jgi:PhoH-like ATPase
VHHGLRRVFYLFAVSISGLPGDENDHRIINCAVYLQKQHSDSKIVLVTKDINMRLKAKGAGLKYVEDYRTDQLIDDIALLTSGYKKIEGDFWQHVGQCETQQHGRDTFHYVAKNLIPDVFCNEYILDGSEHFAARVKSYDNERIKLKDISVERLMHQQAWGVKPKNIYQGMALDALLDPSIELVILTGPAGCGKTGITASFFSIFVQTYLQTLFLLNKLSIYNRLRSNLSNMSLSVT